MEQTYWSEGWAHLGLVAGLFDEVGIGAVIGHATHQNPERRELTVGEAVKAMVLNGLGFVNQALYLVPNFFQNKPTARLIAPRVTPEQLNDDALGRALDTLYASGVTEVYSQIEAALGSSLSARQARLDQHSCFILATNELDPAHLPPHEVLAGSKGQVHAERGFRFLVEKKISYGKSP